MSGKIISLAMSLSRLAAPSTLTLRGRIPPGLASGTLAMGLVRSPRPAQNAKQVVHRYRPRVHAQDALDTKRFLGEGAKLLLLDAQVAQALRNADVLAQF